MTSAVSAQAPLVSVLMTAYNREEHIAEAIESVLSQTFKDFELIIVDDCSTDRTVEIAQSYSNDARVGVYVNERNLGDYSNRNRAASLARGKFLKYLDSDDILYSHGLEVMVKIMQQFPDAALGLQRPEMKDRPYPVVLTPQQSYREHFLMDGLFGVGPSGTIIAASAFHEVGGFSGEKYVGDFELWLKLSACNPVVKLMDGLTWWRSHSNQEISTEGDVFPYGTASYLINRRALLSAECPLNDQDRERALRWCRHRHARVALRLALMDHRPGKAIHVINETGLSLRDLAFAFAPLSKPSIT